MSTITNNMSSDSVERSIGRIEGKLDSAIVAVSQVGGEVKSLRDDFATMEKGRLSRLEVSFASLETTVNLKAKNTAMFWGTIMSIIASIVSAILVSFFLTALG